MKHKFSLSVIIAVIVTVILTGSVYARDLAKPVNMHKRKSVTICVGERASLYAFRSGKISWKNSSKKNVLLFTTSTPRTGRIKAVLGKKKGNSRITAIRDAKKETLVIKVADHKYVNGFCKRCGKKQPRITATPTPTPTAVSSSRQEMSPEKVRNELMKLSRIYYTGYPWDDRAFYAPGYTNKYPKNAEGCDLGYFYGCSAFAFQMSDRTFGKTGYYHFRNPGQIQIGDVIRLNIQPYGHEIIITGVYGNGYEYAEGNFNQSVRWGSWMSKSEMAALFQYGNSKYKK